MNKLYPISEIFTSCQGEGQWAGQLQTFVRLAGCTVGKPFPKERYQDYDINGHNVLPIYTEQCTLYDGRKFPCDTDYRVKERMHSRQILEEIPNDVKHVCITGGEPMMHELDTLFSYLKDAGKKIHIETSGTINSYLPADVWVTCSPKFNVYLSMIQRANEIKILVDEHFSVKKPIEALHDGMIQIVNLQHLAEESIVYLQPVNEENTINANNMRRCMNLQQEYPNFRVCCQLHKAIGTTIGELVR
jgi:7-carboxy-7-deazaguanine synthase